MNQIHLWAKKNFQNNRRPFQWVTVMFLMNHHSSFPHFCSPFHPHLIFSHSHHSCCLCRFSTHWKDPLQHNSPIRHIMRTEGEIKMKRSRSSGEVRRQQHLVRTRSDWWQVKGKRIPQTWNCRAEELIVPSENIWAMFDDKPLVIMYYHGIVSSQNQPSSLPSRSLSRNLVITADQNWHILETAASAFYLAASWNLRPTSDCHAVCTGIIAVLVPQGGKTGGIHDRSPDSRFGRNREVT